MLLHVRKDVAEAIVKTCNSLRSGLSKNGLLTVTTLARCLPGGLDDYVGVMVSLRVCGLCYY